MSNPHVSVVMPVYNAESYVAEAVESILSQTFRDFEFLVFDDGSTDRSLEILQAYTDRDDRIRVFAKQHRGHVPWLNEGIQIARGEFVARMDADDVALPQRFARQVEFLNHHSDCVVVGCDIMMIDPDGDPLATAKHKTVHEDIEADLLGGGHGVIAHPTCMMRRSTLLAVGAYREEFETIEDFDLWFRLAEQGRLANIPEVLLKYRLHHTNVIFTQVERQQRCADRIIREARLRRGLKPLARSVWSFTTPSLAGRHQMWAWHAAGSGYRKTAFKHAFLALNENPFSLKTWAALTRCWLPTGFVSLLKRTGFSIILTKWNGHPCR